MAILGGPVDKSGGASESFKKKKTSYLAAEGRSSLEDTPRPSG